MRAAFDGMSAAYARPLSPEEVEAEADPALRVVRVEGASHAMVAERPAKLITEFAE